MKYLNTQLPPEKMTVNEKDWGISYKELAWVADVAISNERKIKGGLRFGETLLHVCARTDSEEMMLTLLSIGYNVNGTDKFGQTPLFIAAQKGHLEICRILLDAGANPNHQDMLGNTPMIAAINADLDMKFSINIDVMKLLIKSEASLNLTNNERETPLQVACQSERPEIVKFLIEQGALLEND